MSTTTPPNAPAAAKMTADQQRQDRQRRIALEKANAIRCRRGALIREIEALSPQSGAARAAQILIAVPDYAATMKLERLICSVNGFGPGRARVLAPRSRHKPLRRIRAKERAEIANAMIERARNYAPRRMALAQDAEWRDRARDNAQHIRLARVEARRVITGGGSDPREAAMRAARLIAGSRSAPELTGMPLAAIITAIPDYGDVYAYELLERLGMKENITLGELSPQRAERLAIHIATVRPRQATAGRRLAAA